jgi:hypothetical protein
MAGESAQKTMNRMRQKLPSSLERQVLVKNRHCCCICQNDGYGKDVLVHHIDGKNSHNVESNLAVLCLIHASQADAGLQKGKLGSGRKLKPEAVRQYKKMWERKIELGLQHRKEILPMRDKRQLELMYKFEIRKTKNLILSLKDRDKRIKEAFDYFDQLVLEEFISGIDIRNVLLDAYSDIALFTIDTIEMPKRLAKSLWGLILHLVGPGMVRITAKDKKIFLECLRIFETIGEWAGEYNGGIPVLRAVCQQIFEFAKIANWYDLMYEKKKLFVVFGKIHKACAKFEPPGPTRKAKRAINARQAVVHKYCDKAKRLS